ncbi:hypothetical protein AsAng_0003520 [Aureispira anguillae]|uniref:Uncharacterized protein n=1 Tax=Aureispira anguillae TaxID=2864201 RepID=A0A915VKD9_9BACT|nr:hypothetical protein AsAng_0003520 [Aureispira anguillae]
MLALNKGHFFSIKHLDYLRGSTNIYKWPPASTQLFNFIAKFVQLEISFIKIGQYLSLYYSKITKYILITVKDPTVILNNDDN